MGQLGLTKFLLGFFSVGREEEVVEEASVVFDFARLVLEILEGEDKEVEPLDGGKRVYVERLQRGSEIHRALHVVHREGHSQDELEHVEPLLEFLED